MRNLNNTPNLSNDTIQQMLKMAGEKMGTDPVKLRRQLEQGAFQEALGKIPSGQSARIQQVLNDPKALEALLNSPKAKQMLQNLMGGK